MSDLQPKPLSGPHLYDPEKVEVKQPTGNGYQTSPNDTHPFGGLTKEQILMVSQEEAARDVLLFLEGLITITPEVEKLIRLKVCYWTRLFHCQGALNFQALYEKKVRDMAEARKKGKIVVPRKTLMVPFKYKGKTK